MLTPLVAGLVDDMIKDSDPGAEHTQAQTSYQHAAASLFLACRLGNIVFLHVGHRLRLTVDMQTFLRCRVGVQR